MKAHDKVEVDDTNRARPLTRRLPTGAIAAISSTFTAIWLSKFASRLWRIPATWLPFSAAIITVYAVLMLLYLRCEHEGTTLKYICSNLRTPRARFQILLCAYQFLCFFIFGRDNRWRLLFESFFVPPIFLAITIAYMIAAHHLSGRAAELRTPKSSVIANNNLNGRDNT